MNYSPMPLRIETERLLLTPEERKDAEWFTELLNARGTGTFTTEDARERIDAMTVTIETVGIGALVIRTWPDGDALGYTAIVIGRGSLDEKLGFRRDDSTTDADGELVWLVCDR